MQLVQDLHMRCYRLHLRFVALCQSISLEPPYYTKIEFQGHPHHSYPPQKLSGCLAPPNFNVRGHSSGIWSTALEPGSYGGGGGGRTLVFPPLLLIVNN
jgi:hypothetical protein